MIVAFDTYYFDNKAKTICISFDNWIDEKNIKIYSETIENIEDYRSGEFYPRELPCILSLFNKLDLNEIEAIIIDGFVYLDDNNKLGLGGYFFKKLAKKIPVISVSKSNFATIEKNKRILLRGESLKPLFITAAGMNIDKATELIKNMSGKYRIPALLKQLDSLTKEKD